MPLAGLAAGGLGTWLGVRETILVMAAIHVVASLTVLVGPYRRGRDLPTGQMEPLVQASTPVGQTTR
jgi:hypothetical protein